MSSLAVVAKIATTLSKTEQNTNKFRYKKARSKLAGFLFEEVRFLTWGLVFGGEIG